MVLHIIHEYPLVRSTMAPYNFVMDYKLSGARVTRGPWSQRLMHCFTAFKGDLLSNRLEKVESAEVEREKEKESKRGWMRCLIVWAPFGG